VEGNQFKHTTSALTLGWGCGTLFLQCPVQKSSGGGGSWKAMVALRGIDCQGIGRMGNISPTIWAGKVVGDGVTEFIGIEFSY